MSGPTGMALGPFAFQAIGFGNTGFTRSLNTGHVDIAVAVTLNAQQFTGPTSDEITISGVIFDESFGGQSSFDGIAAMAMTGEPLMFISGDAAQGLVHGMYTVQSMDEDKSFIDRGGRARRNAYSIKLKKQRDEDMPPPFSVLGSFLRLFG